MGAGCYERYLMRWCGGCQQHSLNRHPVRGGCGLHAFVYSCFVTPLLCNSLPSLLVPPQTVPKSLRSLPTMLMP